MAIPFSKYIDILSVAGGASLVAQKQPIGRWFTTNQLCPMGSVVEFTSAKNVMNYFGTSSNEYAYAQKYFGFISKKFRIPQRISFARYTLSALGAQIISGSNSFAVASFTPISDGTLTINYTDPTLGLQSGTTAGIDLSSATDLAGVATALQAAIRAISVSDATPFAQATVAYTSSTALNGSRFILSLPSGFGSFGFATSNATSNLATLLGWDIGTPAILSNGNAGTNTLYQEIDRVFDISNNCFTYAFIETLTNDQKELASQWSDEANCEAMYCDSESSVANALTVQALLEENDGTWIQFDSTPSDLQVYQPMAATACIDYNKANASINLMYQQFGGDTAVVTTGAVSDQLDAVNVNYYGATQNAGQQIAFLQRGKCQGSFADATVFLNAVWLKNAIVSQSLSLFLLRDAIPANAEGAGLIEVNLTNIWNQAITNGTILVNKAFSASEKAFIDNLTGVTGSWQQVYNNGYWFTCNIETDATSGEKYFSYLLVYAAADQIRKLQGTNIAVSSAQ